LVVGGVVAVLASAAFVSSANAAGSVGYDISYPQCNATFPSGGAFGIVGVNDGLPFSVNPCLGTVDGASQLGWAGMNAGLYANTADPGPALSSHWPNGQTTPKQCNTGSNPGSNTPECHYDYGWNAAADSYQDAVSAYVALGWASPGATRTPVANQWWLDVEAANSWTSTPTLNVQALQGEADYLTSVGAAGVGFYANASDWQSITGSTTVFSSFPSWVPGAASLSEAESRCIGGGFTGGVVALTQFVSGGFDDDYQCTTHPTMQFMVGPQTLQAGSSSAAITLQVSQPAGSGLSVTVNSSATSGRFATSPGGPWATNISLPLMPGASLTGNFYYQDTKAATPTLIATAAGYGSASQTETVVAAALAKLNITPSNSQTRLGSTVALQANGADAYGNPVAVNPSWSVAPSLGTFSPTSGSHTVFKATTAGSGTITATANNMTATATIIVARRHQSNTCLVPQVKGQTLRTAKRSITAHNCAVGVIRHTASLRIKEGHVLSEKPRPGRRLTDKAKVKLVVSTGR
jgi:hypothetical protein